MGIFAAGIRDLTHATLSLATLILRAVMRKHYYFFLQK